MTRVALKGLLGRKVRASSPRWRSCSASRW